MNIYLGENIKRLRREKDITQETLAEFLGVTFQSISKWERGESYPDITLLPAIAGFFNVSIDELMGVNKAQDEEEIKRLLQEHDNFTDTKLILKAITILRKKFPTDFRVQLRWMGYLIFYDDYDTLEQRIPQIMSIYQNIQNNCTKDSIRICAKRYYIDLMSNLACKKNNTVTFEDYEHVIKEMPLMRDGREMFCYCYRLHNHPDADRIIQEAIEEGMDILYCSLADYYLTSKFSREYQIEILEKTIDFFNYIYNDGNYSRMWRAVMSCYGLLGWFYFEKGNKEKSLHNLKIRAELSIKFDNLDRVTTLHSTLFEGKTFDKHSLGTTFIAKSWSKENILNCPFSDEFRNTAEFKEIIAMLS